MIALIQRVTQAEVRVRSQVTGAIRHGVLAFIGVQKEDTESDADRLLERLLGYRIFADDQGRMNQDLRAIKGGLLLVSQFTLAADTRSGTRPGFSTAAAPERARELFDHLLSRARATHPEVAAGEFGADMQVSLVNDGPVTFWLETRAAAAPGSR
ncbi:MAG TPA: D-aminoacyl-tRNA deacylase [Steroidobacteraceae bacterium]|jgi:D-tyrosyl-tRNA(Tyr) deacylase|nr:D-aminoacyl-tRNA deacylase [Steroidobacteraceae bacterium]